MILAQLAYRNCDISHVNGSLSMNMKLTPSSFMFYDQEKTLPTISKRNKCGTFMNDLFAGVLVNYKCQCC